MVKMYPITIRVTSEHCVMNEIDCFQHASALQFRTKIPLVYFARN